MSAAKKYPVRGNADKACGQADVCGLQGLASHRSGVAAVIPIIPQTAVFVKGNADEGAAKRVHQ